MAYKRPFLRLVAIGKLYEVEDFTFSISLVQSPVGPGIPPVTVPIAVIDAFRTFWQAAPISHEASLHTVKLNEIGTDGKYTQPNTVFDDFAGNVGMAGAAPQQVAPQLAYAVSLETDVSRGRAHAGRFYLPTPSKLPQAGGQLSPGDVEQIRDITDPFLDALNSAVPGYRLGVVSNLGGGTERYVTHARYGRALDTIRSRRTKIPEGYITGEAF
jgi:hypothetical protein